MSDNADRGSATAATPDAASAAERARLVIDLERPPPADLPDEDRRALAWALKDECYAAWSSEPRRAAKAAAALRALCNSAVPSPTRDEIDALAAWTDGIARVTQGQMAEAVASFDLAAQGFRRLGQPRHAAQTQVPRIMALSMLGQHAQAAQSAEDTQREFMAHGDVHAAAKVSLNLGSLLLRQDAYAKAARHYREAAVLFARVGDTEHSVMADIGVADALTSRGDFDDALRMYARARMRAETHGFPVLAALVDESVALLELVRGRYHEALSGLERSRRRYEELSMPQHLAIAEKQLADAYLELRLLPEALALFEHALRKFEALTMAQEQAWTLVQKGRAHALLADSARAMDSLLQASALFAGQRNRVGESAVALARAELAAAAGETQEALALATGAARGFSAAALADGSARADVVRAYALLELGEAAQARQLFDATLERARELQLLSIEVRCLTGQGLTARASGDITGAKAAFAAAVDLFEDQRRALPGDDIRNAFLTDHLRPYRELLRIALDAHAQSGTRERAADVLAQLDRFRARSLGERLAQAADASVDPAAHALRSRLNWLYRRLRAAQDEAGPTTGVVDELRRTERELLERTRRQRLTASTRSHADVADDFAAPQLQSRLGPHDAVVEYGVQDGELFACVVRAAGVHVQRNLARWSDVLEAAQSARFQIETLRHGAAPVQAHMDSLVRRMRLRMERLHELLWAPLADALSGCERALVIAHAQLAALPFAALHDGKRYLGEVLELAIAASARIALHQLCREVAVPTQVLVLGESTRLPNAEHEARFVAGLFARSTVFVGEEATVEALRANAIGADVIHLACHAQFRGDNPMFSAVYLHDGALTAESVEQLRLRPGIVVLSACETGLSEQGHGDEMVGLVRAFLIAGAARVMASLWPVDDEVTAAFMKAFYQALREGHAPTAALRVAQNEVMRQHPHPFYWAGFTLHGGW